MDGKINRTPAEVSLYLPIEDLRWLKDQWLNGRKLDRKTIVSYTDKVSYFITWWADYGEAYDWRLTKAAVIKFGEYMDAVITTRFTKPLAFRTKHASCYRLRSLFGWAYQAGLVEGVDVRPWFLPPDGGPEQRPPVTLEHLQRLMQAAARSRNALRDVTILMFFIGTGCRVSEVAGLTIENVHFEADCSGTALVTGKRTKANRSGQRTIAFDATTGQCIKDYLTIYGIQAGPLWLSADDVPLNDRGIYVMVKRLTEWAGLRGKVRGCHDLRRCFATLTVQQNASNPLWWDLLRRQLGHAHFTQTAQYIIHTPDDIRKALRSPLAPPAS